MKANTYAALAAVLLSLLVAPASRADVQLNSISAAGISAKIIPLAGETGTKNVYLGAFVPGSPDGKWYLRDAAGNWLLYKGGPLPVAAQIPLPLPAGAPSVSVPIANFDISSLTGLEVWVAYGATEAEALADAQHVQKVYTVPVLPAPVLHYTDKVYALWTGAYPFAVTKTSVTMVVNKTSIAGIAPYINCWMAEKPLPDGKVLADCQDVVTYNRHLLYIDPTTDELHEYETAPQVWDTTPTTPGRVCGWCNIYSYPAGTTWLEVQDYDPVHQWDAYAKVADGWFFATDANNTVLNFQSDATGAVTVVKAGTFSVDGTIMLLVSYSN
ncbi:MAG: hypothetical protein K8F27_08000 [Sulfuricellaceae bacterium]|nr:hypothetical protein [Sulfuricellaceae bacterium]